MILLTLAALWILVVSLVAGLCMAARRGDAEYLSEPAGHAGSELGGRLAVSSHASPLPRPRVRRERPSARSSLTGVGGRG
jgi:hypothetical protein